MPERLVEAIVDGITNGAAYGLVAMGLVLVYKISRTFNLAQGEIGTVSAYVTYSFFAQHVPYGVAIVLGLVAGVVAAVALERLVIWPLRFTSRVTPLVATGAIATSAIGVEVLITNNNVRILPPIIHGGGFVIDGARVDGAHLIVIAIALFAAILGTLFFSRTMLGTAIRATADEPLGARVTGLPLAKISMLVWGMAGLLAALGGLLLAPGETISPGFVTQNVLIDALAAMVIGGLTSLPGAALGGIIVGVGEAIAFTEVPNSLPGASAIIVFGLLVLTLLFRPQGLLGRAT